MPTDTFTLALLLIYSLAVGTGISIFYDAIMLTVDIAFPKPPERKGRVRILSPDPKAANEALYQTDKGFCVRDAVLILTDILFFAVSAAALVVLIMHVNHGKVRAFSLVGAVFGFGLYRKTLSKPLTHLARIMLKALKRVLSAVLCPIFRPLRRFMLGIKKRYGEKKTKKAALRAIYAMEQSEKKREEKRKNRQ